MPVTPISGLQFTDGMPGCPVMLAWEAKAVPPKGSVGDKPTPIMVCSCEYSRLIHEVLLELL